MTEHKFTDEEVIKALECHADLDVSCYGRCKYANEMRCGSKMAKDALALINRQKVEIEDLREIVFMDRSEAIKKIQSDAIKEFLTTVLEKKDIAWHFSPPSEVVSIDVLEHYARELQEGSHETD